MIGKNDRFTRGTSLQCSFCGKTQDEVRKLVAGPSVYICDECVDLCVDILSEELEAVPGAKLSNSLPTPHEIRAYLDRYVIGELTIEELMEAEAERSAAEKAAAK